MKCKVLTIHLKDDYKGIDEEKVNGFLNGRDIKQVFGSLTSEVSPAWSILIFYEDENDDELIQPSEFEDILTPQEEILYEELRRWRNKKASQEKLEAYMIAHNKCLKQVAMRRPRTIEELLTVKGFGDKRTAKYGEEILSIIKNT